MIDFVFPHNNEEEFAEIGARLGYKKLVFVYNYGQDIGKIKEKIKKLNNKLEIEFGLLALPKYIIKANKLTKYVLVQNSKENRFVFEKNKDLIIFNLEYGFKDFIHHRASGLNQVLCRLAKENNITVAFSFNLLLKADPKSRAKILGRMKQNVKLCRKYKVKTLIASFADNPYCMRDYKDMQSILV